MPGPPRKPTVLKLLQGNPGKKPLPKGEPMLPPACPDPPDTLSDQARPLARLEPEMQREVWRDVVEATPPDQITAKRVEAAARTAFADGKFKIIPIIMNNYKNSI